MSHHTSESNAKCCYNLIHISSCVSFACASTRQHNVFLAYACVESSFQFAKLQMLGLNKQNDYYYKHWCLNYKQISFSIFRMVRALCHCRLCSFVDTDISLSHTVCACQIRGYVYILLEFIFILFFVQHVEPDGVAKIIEITTNQSDNSVEYSSIE